VQTKSGGSLIGEADCQSASPVGDEMRVSASDSLPPVEYVVVNGKPGLRIKCRDRCLRQMEMDREGKGEQCPCGYK